MYITNKPLNLTSTPFNFSKSIVDLLACYQNKTTCTQENIVAFHLFSVTAAWCCCNVPNYRALYCSLAIKCAQRVIRRTRICANIAARIFKYVFWGQFQKLSILVSNKKITQTNFEVPHIRVQILYLQVMQIFHLVTYFPEVVYLFLSKGEEEQTSDHAVLHCRNHRPLYEVHGLMVLDDVTI